MKDVSIIVTSYNATATIGTALASVAETPHKNRIEVIVVDDSSTDRTVEIIDGFCRNYDHIRLIRLPRNSGSPSLPRNIGISQAKASYLTFLDDDDYIDADRLIRMVDYAKCNGIQYLKGYLKTVKAGIQADACRILAPCRRQSDRIKQIIAQQSTTSDVILQREFLIHSGVLFNEKIKIGEDTLFHTALLSCRPIVDYVDNYFLYYCKHSNRANLSSTQEFSEKAIYNHLFVWKEAEKNLNKIGLSYFALRLPSAFRWILHTIVRQSGGIISEPCFRALSDFVNQHRKHLQGRIPLHTRHQNLFQSIVHGDYHLFQRECRGRLLVSGEGLEQLKPLFNRLESQYIIRYDEGARSDSANTLLNWADIIWCSGLQGNTAWYSQNKLNHQTLIIQTGGYLRQNVDVDFDKADCLMAPTFFHKSQLCAVHGVAEHKAWIFNPIVATVPEAAGAKGMTVVAGFAPDSNDFHQVAGRLDSLLCGGDHPVPCKNMHATEEIELQTFPDWDSYIQSFVQALQSGRICFLLSRPGVEYCYSPHMVFHSIDSLVEEIRRIRRSPEAYDEVYATMREFAEQNFSLDIAAEELSTILKQARL